MSHLPCYICIGVLALTLIIQTLGHKRTERGLINKILELRGLEPIPESSPVRGMLETLAGMRKPYNQEQEKKKAAASVTFKMPNADLWPKEKEKTK